MSVDKYIAIPESLVLHDECTPNHLAVVCALTHLAGQDGCVTGTREAICNVAGVGVHGYIAARRWLLGLNAIEEEVDHDLRSGRRIKLAWNRARKGAAR